MADRNRNSNRPATDGHRNSVVPGSLASLETTLPPTPLKKLLEADGASVFVLSADRELIEAVHAAAGEQYPVYDLTEWDDLIGQVEQGRCRIVLLDAGLLRQGIERRIAQLQARTDRIVVLVAATRDVAQSLIGLMSERAIHRLLIKPAAVGITRLLLESAVSRYLQLRDTPAPADEDLVLAANPRHAPPVARTGGLPIWITAVALVALLIGAVAATSVVRLDWFGAEPAGPPTPAARRAEPGNADAAIPEVAVASSQIATVEPAEAEADPESPPARPFGAGSRQAESLAAGSSGAGMTPAVPAPTERPAEAPALPASTPPAAMRSSDQTPGGLPPARAAEALPAAGDGQANDEASGAGQPPRAQNSELNGLLGLASARLEDGQISAPGGNNALHFFRLAEAIDPFDPAVIRVREQLAAVVAVRARLELEAGDIDGAQELVDEAERLGAAPETLLQLDVDVAAAREQARQQALDRLAAAVRDRMTRGQLIAPAEDNALGAFRQLEAASAAPTVVEPLRVALSRSLERAAQASIEAGQWAEAGQLADALAVSGGASGAETAAGIREAVRVARRQAVLLSEPAAPGALELLAALPADYPPEARSNGIEGWVDVEFVVGEPGIPEQIRVLAAEPAGSFEAAATAAVANYRYVPYREDGRVYPRLIQLRIRFDLQ